MSEKNKTKGEAWQALKFTLFSISARREKGNIQ